MIVAQIDGLSGTGKSTLARELLRRGWCAVDADAEFAYFGDPVTGRPTDVRVRANWVWDIARVRAFVRGAPSSPLFVCGGALNQEQCTDLFTHRFLLCIDDDTMMRRLQSRTTNDFGKDPAELSEQLELNRRLRTEGTPAGWIIVDATRPVVEVADYIVERLAGERAPAFHPLTERQDLGGT